jgi:AraC-like DNA-binding protein
MGSERSPNGGKCRQSTSASSCSPAQQPPRRPPNPLPRNAPAQLRCPPAPHVMLTFVRLSEAKRLLRTTRRIATSPTASGPPEQWVRHVSTSAQEKICTKRGSLRRKSCEVTAGPTQKSKFLFTFFPHGVLSLSFLASPFATHATRVFLAATQSPPREIRRQIPSSYRQIDRLTGMMAPSSSPLPPHRSKMTLV